MQKIIALCFVSLFSLPAFCAEELILEQSQILQQDTTCSTAAFADALAQRRSEVSETDTETRIQQWIYETFQDKDVLEKVLACPEFATLADDETIKFMPIQYTFPGGREIVVNYETQPKVLKQRISLSQKREITDLNPSPWIGAPNDNSTWTNTDPAWYAIMVVESGSLDNFVGKGKSNTISMQWINDNIDAIYPKGNRCTSKSALAEDKDIINIAMHETVNIEDDSNDYYVAGDVSLQWITYLEIGLDVAITVLTMGGGTVALGMTKSARASKTLKNLTGTLRKLSKTDSVVEYVKATKKYTDAAEELKKIDKAKDAATYAKKSDEVKSLADTMKRMEQSDDNVKQYKQAMDTFTSLNQYRRNLRLLRPAQRGNVVARLWKYVKSATTGGKELKSGAKIARSSMQSGKVRDWLFQSTLSNLGALAKLEAGAGAIYGAIKLAGGMFYDITETSTGDFTNNIEFKPLCLLSADDLTGQENVINYGMWLMWAGDYINPADDDAAYLQAMDFADKFHYNLEKTQEEQDLYACNVDIYIVRPVIRNPGTENAELYYLIMNDQPWSTSSEK